MSKLPKLKLCEGALKKWKGDALVLLLREEDCTDSIPFAGPYEETVKEMVRRKDFTGKKGSMLRIPLLEGDAKNLYLVGLGKTEEGSAVLVRDTVAQTLRALGRHNCESALLLPEGLERFWENEEKDKNSVPASELLAEAAELAGYSFDAYKKKKAPDEEKEEEKKSALKELSAPELKEKAVERGRVYASAQRYARDLANEPGNVINPSELAERALALAESCKEAGLNCVVWDEKRLKEERMGALLAVGSGSHNPPRFIHMSYKPQKARKKIVLVGKGITFDSGGLNIKPDNYMATMKGDKSGACNVLGIMKGAVELGLKLELHGLIAAAENMPSGTASRPDDIVRARNGKTIEITNTDAEGRVILADALSLASELKPDAIIDMATLTGACVVALGKGTAGLFTRDDDLAEELLASARRRGERLWRLPAEDEVIAEGLKSNVADLVNSGGRYGGATFGALFLAEFVEKDIPWAHLDIAGVDFCDKERGVYSKGATAFGVRTCLDYLCRLSEE